MRSLLSFLLVACVGALPAGAQDAGGPPTKAVLVTGASTGIGHKITERLAARGYFVYAGARRDTDLAALNQIRNVQAVRLDVTKQEDIDAAVASITKAGRGLHGLVNNAGVATFATLPTMDLDEFDLMMKVNVYGPLRLSRAFLPLLTSSKGRITNISSIAGINATATVGGYSMTKHAIEAFTDVLAAEVAAAGVRVNVIEPGNFNSEIAANAQRRVGRDLDASADRSRYKEPDEVAVAVEQALFEPSPKRRYLVTPDQSEAERTIKGQIDQVAQLNERHAYSFDRAALIKFLDEALAKFPPK
jgi:NAD(P)-dependent dehydrogenase (short-subunit alcohol dehydrogenase family)